MHVTSTCNSSVQWYSAMFNSTLGDLQPDLAQSKQIGVFQYIKVNLALQIAKCFSSCDSTDIFIR